MQNIINGLINTYLIGVDTYRFKDSTWLIFSEDKRWVFEMTDCGTLWFNYNIFKNILSYVSLNPSESHEYITEWAKNHFFRQDEDWEVYDSDATYKENAAVTVVLRGVKKTKEKGIRNTFSDIIPDEYNWSSDFNADKAIKEGRKYSSF